MIMNWISSYTDIVVYGTWSWFSTVVNGAYTYGSSATSWFPW